MEKIKSFFSGLMHLSAFRKVTLPEGKHFRAVRYFQIARETENLFAPPGDLTRRRMTSSLNNGIDGNAES